MLGRSNLLEEFRTNKHKKYELQVIFHNYLFNINNNRILLAILLNLAEINMVLDLFSRNLNLHQIMKSN